MYTNVVDRTTLGIHMLKRPKRKCDWTDEEIQILKDNFNKLFTKDLQKLLPKRTRAAIGRFAGRIGLTYPQTARKRYKYNVKHDYFSVPTIENSYWAGYIAADGNLDSGNKYIRLVCTKEDRELLDNLKETIGFTGPIRDIKGKILKVKKKRYQCRDSCKMEIYSHKIYDDLKNIWNIPPKKSLILEPPNLENDLYKYAFIVGYLDGDGSSSILNNGQYVIKWFGTYKIMTWIRNHLIKLCPNVSWKCKVCKHGSIYQISYAAKKARIIYQSLKNIIAIPKLTRKWKYEWDDVYSNLIQIKN